MWECQAVGMTRTTRHVWGSGRVLVTTVLRSELAEKTLSSDWIINNHFEFKLYLYKIYVAWCEFCYTSWIVGLIIEHFTSESILFIMHILFLFLEGTKGKCNAYPPPPRTRGYLSSFHITWIPPPPPPPVLRKVYIFYLGYMYNHWQLPPKERRKKNIHLFHVLLGDIFPRLRLKIPLSRENGNTYSASLCIRVGAGMSYVFSALA